MERDIHLQTLTKTQYVKIFQKQILFMSCLNRLQTNICKRIAKISLNLYENPQHMIQIDRCCGCFWQASSRVSPNCSFRFTRSTILSQTSHWRLSISKLPIGCFNLHEKFNLFWNLEPDKIITPMCTCILLYILYTL